MASAGATLGAGLIELALDCDGCTSTSPASPARTAPDCCAGSRPGTSCPGSGPALRPGRSPRPATDLLDCFAARDRALAECTQSDVDAWAFLLWSAMNRLSPRFELPARPELGPCALAERDRTVLLGQLLTDDRARCQ